jgi:caffeoyl-CoA O-methyltransferase
MLQQPHGANPSLLPQVVTIEKDLRAARIAHKYFQLFPSLQVSLLCLFLSALGQIDLKIGSVGEVLQSLVSQSNEEKFDFVFIDADKRASWSYLSTLLGDGQDLTHPSLLFPGALIVTDNTLWKGRVLKELERGPSQASAAVKDAALDKKQQRAEQLTRAIHDFNMRCASHPSLRTVMLPLRDGLTISRYVPAAAT